MVPFFSFARLLTVTRLDMLRKIFLPGGSFDPYSRYKKTLNEKSPPPGKNLHFLVRFSPGGFANVSV